MEWLVMILWCLQPNYCYIHFPYAVAWCKIIFQKSKRPQTDLLMGFNSIRIIVCYTFSRPKINMWSDWWWLLSVSSQSIVIFTFSMLLHDGKSFCRSQKDLRLIYLCASVELEILYHRNEFVEWLVMFSCCFQSKFYCIHF